MTSKRRPLRRAKSLGRCDGGVLLAGDGFTVLVPSVEWTWMRGMLACGFLWAGYTDGLTGEAVRMRRKLRRGERVTLISFRPGVEGTLSPSTV